MKHFGERDIFTVRLVLGRSALLPLLAEESCSLLGSFLHQKAHFGVRRLEVRLNSLPL
jgi:hypothetical protein